MENPNDHDLIIELKTVITEFRKEVTKRLDDMSTDLTANLKDHEKRLRFLEKSLYLTWGGIVVITTILTLASNYFKH